MLCCAVLCCVGCVSTQSLLAIYCFLAGLLVQRHPLLWIMPITSTLFALLHGALGVLAGCSSSYRALGTLARARFCGAVCRLVYSLCVSVCALALLAAAPSMVLLSPPSPLQGAVAEAAGAVSAAVSGPVRALGAEVAGSKGVQALVAAAASAAGPVQQVWTAATAALPPTIPTAVTTALSSATAAVQRAATQLPQQPAEVLGAQHAWVLLPCTVLCCVAAGFYAYRLFFLMRGRSASGATNIALLRYTLLLLVYSVASFKSSQVALLAGALACEAVGVPAAAGKVLDLLAAGGTAAARARRVHTSVVPRSGGSVRKGLLLLERTLFPLLR